MVSIGWYLGFLKGQLGGAGAGNISLHAEDEAKLFVSKALLWSSYLKGLKGPQEEFWPIRLFFNELVLLLMGVLRIRTLIFGVYIRALFWETLKLPLKGFVVHTPH